MYYTHIRVMDHNERIIKYDITSCRREGQPSYIELPRSEIRKFLKCDCGHHDFREGSAINSYECDGCGMETHVCNAPIKQAKGGE